MGMSRAEYDEIPAINQSTLKKWKEHGLGRCPKAFHYEMANNSDNDNLKLGRAIDIYCIEGQEAFDRKVVVYDGIRRGKEWSAFKELHVDHEIIKPGELESITGMAKSLKESDDEGAYGRCTKAVFVTELCGNLVKGEIDLYSPGSRIIRDQKKTRDCTPAGFGKQAADLGYHIQAAFYLDAIQSLGEPVEQFTWITVEDFEPYLVAKYYATIDSPEIEDGRNQYRSLMLSYLAGKHSQAGMGDIKPLTFPKWHYK